SLYNQTGEVAILPTPVVATLGVIDDVTTRIPSSYVAAGQKLVLLGETREELSGSEWAHVVHGHLGGLPPRVDLAAEKALGALLGEARGLVTSAHDLSDGGLMQALAEPAIVSGIGVSVTLPGDPFLALFSESVARAVVTVPEADLPRLTDLAQRHGVPVSVLGETGGAAYRISYDGGQIEIPLEELGGAWRATLRDALA
ncbi:MAG: phosphoribosylformylglycinamidine synthase II, partial [Nocardioides sp.]|nr:phosphoribosylformylglycinamidine synthase II [Nocardioides sp.]